MPSTAAAPPRRPTRREHRRDGADTKHRILTAAEEVVLRDGVAHLTLDAAAAQAGLSKGGVLYHFPSRDALVAGMVDKIIGEFETDIARHLPVEGSPESDAPARSPAPMCGRPSSRATRMPRAQAGRTGSEPR